MDFSSPLFPLIIGILIFLVFREVVTWYWKINKIVSLLEQIEENTRKPDDNKEEVPTNPVSESKPAGNIWRDGKWVDK
jgi:hypothetical protein